METLKLRQVGLWRVQSWDSNPRSVLLLYAPCPAAPVPRAAPPVWRVGSGRTVRLLIRLLLGSRCVPGTVLTDPGPQL